MPALRRDTVRLNRQKPWGHIVVHETRRTYRLVALIAGLALALSACASKPVAPAATPAPAASPATPAKPNASPDAATLKQYRTWIGEARTKYPYAESADRMYAVMMCESGGRASIINPVGPYKGLFQYSPLTWSGPWNTYNADGILDPKAQVFATALAWSLKMQRQWGCYKKKT